MNQKITTMKNLITLIFFISGNILIAQNKFQLGLGISNQGQFDNLLEDFYFPAHPTAMQDDAHLGKDLRIKYNFSGSYSFHDSLEFRIRVGYAIRKNHYEQKFPTTALIVNDKQNILEFNPSFGFRKNWGRFSFSTGLEIPIYVVGDLEETIDFKEFSDSINLSYSANSTYRMDGGLILGLNHYLNVRTFFSKQIFMFSEINYGILYSKLGGKFKDVGESTFPTVINSTYEYDKTYSKIYFSQIQVHFGIGYKF